MTEDIMIPVQRYRRAEEKMAIQTKIANLRLIGQPIKSIALEIGLSERQVRRHQKEFFESKLKDLIKEKQIFFSQLIYQFELSIDQTNSFLEQAKTEGDPVKIGSWLKLRQEFLVDYKDFLQSIGFFRALIQQLERTYDPSPLDLASDGAMSYLEEKMLKGAEKEFKQFD